MRHSAITFANQVDNLWESGDRWDVIFTTDMCSVAEFRGLLKTDARKVPVVVYFHENQLVYPNQSPDHRDLHFAFSNLTTALAADAVWFNSDFNRQSMIAELKNLSKKWPDFSPIDEIESINLNSTIQPPGIECPILSSNVVSRRDPDSIQLVWAARWEHDKNPAELLEILRKLELDDVNFRLSVLGESFRNTPPEFEAIQNEFSNRIDQWGYLASREEYWQALVQADVFLSTANHEFFGLSVCEGLAAGLTAVLPNRLAYPEIKQRFYDGESKGVRLYDTPAHAAEFVSAIAQGLDILRQTDNRRQNSARIAGRLSWDVRATDMDNELQRVVLAD